MANLPIGEQVSLAFTFRGNPQFSVAPQWELIAADNSVILSGTTAVGSNSDWTVTFTIPSTYVTPSGNQSVSIEVFGLDTTGKVRSVEAEYQLLDAVDSFTPMGVLAMDNRTIVDQVTLESKDFTAADFTVGIYTYAGTELLTPVQPTLVGGAPQRVVNKSDVPDRFTEASFMGYRYTLSVPGFAFPAKMYQPYQVHIANASADLLEVHPLFRLNHIMLSHVSSLRSYLDKARLVEIDTTLQWHDDELALALIEGMNYINGFPSTMSFWTVDDTPTTMYTYLRQAAAFHALNARYLAEGMTAFDFNGLSTTLTVDRREAITYKLEEIKGFLDSNLKLAKDSAIRAYGTGVPSPEDGAVKTGVKNVATLGLSYGLSSNRRGINRNQVRSYFGGY